MRIYPYLTLGAVLAVKMIGGGAEARVEPLGPPATQARSSVPDTVGRLVAVVYQRRDETTGAVRAELHPLAYVRNGEYRDATWPAVEEGGVERFSLSMLPVALRRFTIYEQGHEVGRMTVASVNLAPYACLKVPVGLGPVELEAPDGAFDEQGPRVDRYRGWVDGASEDYSLRYSIALSEPVRQPEYAVDSSSAPAAAARLRGTIMQAARDTLQRLDPGQLQSEERARSESRLEEFRLVDLDRDGVPEAVGRVAVEVQLQFDYHEGDETDAYRLTAIVWASDRGADRPPLLLALRADVQSPGSWGEGWELVEVMDLTGDRRAEVVYEWSGYESNSFYIFTLGDERLIEVFGGGGFGC